MVRTIHLLLHYTKNLNVTLYLSVMYDSNAKYVSHEIRDLNGIHDPYDYVYMMSNYEMYVNYVSGVIHVLREYESFSVKTE